MLALVPSTVRPFVSRLGFGTARLHHVSAGERQRLLAAAAECGIVHFDTAPCYGDGLAERVLGRFLKSGRDRYVVATKYGLPADPLVSLLGLPARAARSVVRGAGWWPQARPALCAPDLRASVHASLRRLQTDRIDILFLHEPALQRFRSLAEVLDEMRRLQEAGHVRAIGLAGRWCDVAAVADAASGLPLILQTAETEWDGPRVPDITYSAMMRGPQRAFAAAIDPSSAVERLCAALRRRPDGVVLISTTRIDHLDALAAAAQSEQACCTT